MTMRALLLILLLPVAGMACAGKEPIKPVPTLAANPARAALGQQLFGEVRLSGNGRVSCASCHAIPQGGADGRARSPGLRGRPTARNAPTVLNAALNFRQFWDGSAATLEQQVAAVVSNPDEMGGHWPEVVRRLQSDPGYRNAFAAAYADGVTAANIQDALASYERTLTTPGSRFDRYLRGDDGAISNDERAGYQRFKQYGCIACHQGVNVGGNMYQRFGVMGDIPGQRGRDGLGQRFKVPGLRNVARTAPYLHDGSAASLEEAVGIMFEYQLGRIASTEDRRLIAQFLRSLDADPRKLP
jgi:cytochrome c peroxidase